MRFSDKTINQKWFKRFDIISYLIQCREYQQNYIYV